MFRKVPTFALDLTLPRWLIGGKNFEKQRKVKILGR